MEYRLSKRAKIDIGEIYLSGHANWGENRVDSYYLGLLSAFEAITEFPLASPERSEVEAGLRIKVFRSHLIIYEMDHETPVILRIVHGHYDWQGEL